MLMMVDNDDDMIEFEQGGGTYYSQISASLALHLTFMIVSVLDIV